MNIIGLDLGTESIKAVELKKDSHGNFSLVEFAIEPSPKANIQSDSAVELEEYSKYLRGFIRSHSFTTRNVAVSLPESQIFSRVISMPNMSENELSKSIKYEAEQYIPIPLDDVNLDYEIIDTKDKMEVLLVASSKSLVEKYIRILRGAGLIPVALEPETTAIVRSSLGRGEEFSGATLIINIGSLTTELAIVFKGFIRFSRSISTGGTALSRAISQELGFEMNQAEEYKKSYGLDESQLEGKVVNVIKPVFDVIVNDIKRAVAFFSTHNQEIPIRRAVICGGTSQLPGILVYLAKELNLEVQQADPFRNIQMNGKFPAKEIEDQQPLLCVAVGLAMKEV